jgi:hypothetical protein
MTAAQLLKMESPLARGAVDVLRSGTFGEGMDADRVRFWMQDQGLADGRALTPDGLALRAELRASARKDRHGF